MTGTGTTVVTTVPPNGKAAVALSAESRARLNFLGQAWVRAKVELATLRVVPDYTWVDTLVKQSNGEKLSITTIAQGFTAGTQKEKELKAQQEALTAFASGTFDRIRAVMIEAPADAKTVLAYWMNELVARTTEISSQASSLTAGFDELSALVSDGALQSDPTGQLAELQQSVQELNQLIEIITAAAGAGATPTDTTQAAQAYEDAAKAALKDAHRARKETARFRAAAQQARAEAKEQVRTLRRELRQATQALRKSEARAARATAKKK